MSAVDVVAIAALLIGGATLGVTIPALVLTRRQEKRSTERSVVDWYADEVEDGVIRITNQGLDPAHEATAEVWDRHDSVTKTEDAIRPGESRVIVLPHRQTHGAAPAEIPRAPRPRVPDTPPPEE
jgi:hypothetical protein